MRIAALKVHRIYSILELAGREAASVKDLRTQLDLDPRTLTSLPRSLVNAGWLERVHRDGDYRTVKAFRTTDKGREIMPALEKLQSVL